MSHWTLSSKNEPIFAGSRVTGSDTSPTLSVPPRLGVWANAVLVPPMTRSAHASSIIMLRLMLLLLPELHAPMKRTGRSVTA